MIPRLVAELAADRVVAQRWVEPFARERVEQVLHAMGQRPRPRRREEERIEDEDGDDLAGARGLPQRRVIGESKVLAAEPDDRPHDITTEICADFPRF